MDVNKKPKKTIDLTPVSVTTGEALEQYLSMEKPSIEVLHAALKADGHKVSYDWLKRQCRNGNWVAKRRTLDQSNNAVMAKAELTALADQGTALSAKVYEGLEGRLITGMTRLIDDLQPSMASDLFILCETLQMIQKMTHDRRGLDIGGKDAATAEQNFIPLGDFTVPKPH